MKRTGFLPLAAASVLALLAGCVSDYRYREGAGDYYYGQPSVEYRDYGYGGYGYPGGWGGSIGFGYGYGGYGYPYGGYGYPYGGYGYPYYPPLIFLPGYYGGHHRHHGGHDQPDPVPYRSQRPPHRIGGDGTPNTPIMMPTPRSRMQEPPMRGPGIQEQAPPQARRAFVLPPSPRAERNDSPSQHRIQAPPRSTRDRDERRNSEH